MTIWAVALFLQLTGAPQASEVRPPAIRGTVVVSATGVPIVDAELALNFIGQTGAGRREVKTDSNGSFGFFDLGAGRYYLLASHPDYLDQAYGSPLDSSMRGSVGEFTLGAGQQLQAPIRMLRAATLSGRIYDANRAPVANASVRPRILLKRPTGASLLGDIQPGEGIGDINRIFVKTNDRGEYRMTGLPPGEYYISASPAAPAGTRSPTNNAATTYYPGFRNPDQGVPVKVAASAVIVGIDFALEPVSTLKVSGKLNNPLVGQMKEGTDFGYQFFLVPRNARVMELSGGASTTLPDSAPAQDEFELRNVAPGSYELFAAFQPRPTNPRVGFVYEVARAPVNVTDRDVVIDLTIVPGVDIVGKLVLDDSAKALISDLNSITFQLQPADNLPVGFVPRLDPGQDRAADGSFIWRKINPGSYYFNVFLNPRLNVYLSGARMGTRDILNQAFEIDPKTVEPLILEVSGQAGTITGVVTDRNSMPSSARVVFVPPIELRRQNPAYKVTQTDAQGRFTAAGLTPGTYTAYAFAKIADGAWLDPQYMAAFGANGVSITVERNSKVQRDLKLIP